MEQKTGHASIEVHVVWHRSRNLICFSRETILNSQGTTKLINAGTNDCLNFAGRSMTATMCSMLHLTKTELGNEKLNSLA